MQSDIEIAQRARLLPIGDVAAKLGLSAEDLDYYGKYKAKIGDDVYKRTDNYPDGKLILVTAVNPTPAGEGKTTTTVGLGQAMAKIGKKACIALREPSLGPVFGIKGGAAGGGYAQVVPMEDINLHFTGDIHAVTAANNLLCAMIDNHIHQGNELRLDPENVAFKRVMDMNDRALREIDVGLGGSINGVPRKDGFMISVASEVMAILCLASDLHDLRERLGRIIAAYDMDGKPVHAADLKANGAMAVLLKDALRPNLVQTLEGTPCLMHGGPFANIAHGCNSLRATKLALKLADYCITEAGFGADLGAEKFFDIVCPTGGLRPDAVVLVATVRALKYNGGVDKSELLTPNLEAIAKGGVNLEAHIENLAKFGLPTVVALNRFPTDTIEEIAAVRAICEAKGARCCVSEVFGKGGDGGMELAQAVVEAAAGTKSAYRPLYGSAMSIEDKIAAVAVDIYGASGVDYTPEAVDGLRRVAEAGLTRLPVCIAKTQYSLSDDAKKLGRPKNFRITIRHVQASAGAGFVVALAGNIMTMPGLPKVPAAQSIDIDAAGNITGLF